MSDIDEEDQETYAGCVTRKEQRVYIKIKYLKPTKDYSRIITNHHKFENHKQCLDGDSRMTSKLRIWKIWFVSVRSPVGIHVYRQRAQIRFVLVCNISKHYSQSHTCNLHIFIQYARNWRVNHGRWLSTSQL